MVRYKRSLVFLFIYTIAFFLKGSSQNISGDTIFINSTLTYTVVLPTVPTSFSTIPDNTSYKIKPEKSFIIITTEKENLPPAILKVSEGGRVHSFTLFYKKEIDFSNPNTGIKDYPTLKRLKERVDELALHKSASEEKKSVPVNQKDINKKTTTESSSAKVIPLQMIQENNARENNSKYLKIITAAGNYKREKNYVRARELYTQALAIKPDDVMAIKELVETNALSKQDSAQKENQRLSDNYKKFLSVGEIAYNKNQLSESRAAFNQALIIMPTDESAIKYIKLIEAKETYQRNNEQLNKNYEASVALADKLFNSGDYDNSREAYKTALGFIKKDYPKKQIISIDKFIAERPNKEKEENQKYLKDEKEIKHYETLLKNADIEFEKGNLSDAKKFYHEASRVKPAEEYPKSKLKYIDIIVDRKAADLKGKNDSIEVVNETNKKYNEALKKGKSYSARNDLVKAKNAYEEAMKWKPLENEPEKQLEIIKSRLADIRRKNEMDSDYIRTISIADSLSKIELYDSALKAYSEAQIIKPAELYAIRQIEAMQNRLARIKQINENNKRIEDQRNYNEAISNANKYYSNKKNYDSKSEFIKAQSIHSLTNTDQQRFNNLLYQIDKYQKDSLSKIPVIEPHPEKSKRKKSSRRKGKNNNTFKIWHKSLEHDIYKQAGFSYYAPPELKT